MEADEASVPSTVVVGVSWLVVELIVEIVAFDAAPVEKLDESCVLSWAVLMVVGKVSVLLLVVESADIVCCRRVEVQREVESVQ